MYLYEVVLGPRNGYSDSLGRCQNSLVIIQASMAKPLFAAMRRCEQAQQKHLVG